jgi:hypothetical protein
MVVAPDRRPEKDSTMMQNIDDKPAAAPAAGQTVTPNPQPTAVQPVKGDAAKVEIAEKK